MFKKHFEALADALAAMRPVSEDDRHVFGPEWDKCVSAVASVCEQSNPRFDREKFVRACNER